MTSDTIKPTQEPEQDYLYNYKKSKFEFGTITEQNATNYLPQDPNVQGLYRCHIGMGDNYLYAMEKALKCYLGIPHEGGAS